MTSTAAHPDLPPTLAAADPPRLPPPPAVPPSATQTVWCRGTNAPSARRNEVSPTTLALLIEYSPTGDAREQDEDASPHILVRFALRLRSIDRADLPCNHRRLYIL